MSTNQEGDNDDQTVVQAIDLPPEWTSQRLKHVTDVLPSNVNKKSKDGEQEIELCNYREVYNNNRIHDELEFMEATATESQIKRFSLRAGDILLTKDSELWDDIGKPAYVPADFSGVVCGYHLFVVRPNSDLVDPRFLFWALDSRFLAFQFERRTKGVTRFGLTTYNASQVQVPLPPISIQERIAKSLSRSTARIDALVEKQKRLLDLLEEKRQAVITRAVTKGLDSNVAMKSSDAEWLEDIPENWDITKLMYLVHEGSSIVYGILKPGPDIKDGVPYIGAGDIIQDRLSLEELPRTSAEIASEYTRSEMNAGELVYAIRGSFGSVAVLPDELDGANLSRDAARIAPADDVDAHWLCWALRSEPSQRQFEANETGTAVTGVNIRDLKRLILPLPSQSEQKQIAAQISESVSEIREQKDAILELIDLLEEKRQALITAAVTGQIDVTEEHGEIQDSPV